MTLTVSWNHKCDVAPRSYSTLNGVLVPLTLSRTLRSQPLKKQLFVSCCNSALLPQPTLKSRLLLDEVKLDLVEPDHIKPHFTRLKSNRSLRSGHFFGLTIFLDRKINSWRNQNKDVVILIPKPKLMVLKKHYSECNLYTLINYLGQGVKTIPNDITFRQPTEYFQHWVRCDIFLLVFGKITILGTWHYYSFWYQ